MLPKFYLFDIMQTILYKKFCINYHLSTLIMGVQNSGENCTYDMLLKNIRFTYNYV